MTENPPILNAPSPAANSLEALRKLFPNAIETDPQGRIRINASALQLALDPANPAGVQVEEDGFELRWVDNHFEREEALFKLGIKSLSLFFIDAVARYLPDGQRPADIRTAFETHYRARLALTLARTDLHPPYRAYLERSADDIGRVHKGYFARSHSEKGEEEAIKLILQEKEKLLSFDTDLRFIFSMWALQEGWDNPNVFTLCKLAPSNSRITRLQQIGRGLRLAVDQRLERVPVTAPTFEEVNELVVVVPASEGDFVSAIQAEIAAHSVQRVSPVFDEEALIVNKIAPSNRVAIKLIDVLEALKVVSVDQQSGKASLLLERSAYHARRDAISAAMHAVAGLMPEGAQAMLRYLDAVYEGHGQVKRKADRVRTTLTPRPSHFEQFKTLWAALNRDVVMRFELNTPALVGKIVAAIANDFDVRPLTLTVERALHVQDVSRVESTQASYEARSHTVYTLAEFITELANATTLSRSTLAQVLAAMPAAKFAQIRHNEGRAFSSLRDLILRCVFDLLVHQVSYELRETRVKTTLTDAAGALLPSIQASLCGTEWEPMTNPQLLARSLYEQPGMPVDSQIERDTTQESSAAQITVFAKLPHARIQTPVGDYNPDFGYVLKQGNDAKAIYLVVETKGYDHLGDVPGKERWKIDSAKRFFEALRQDGLPVQFETKLNGQGLTQILQSLSALTPPRRDMTPLTTQGLTAPLRLANFKLAAFDMDSTLISIECIDEIAALAGKGEQVAAITEAAMRGEITDFRDSLQRRLALLAGVPATVLDRVLAERLTFNPGARELCAALKAAGLKLVLVSGGFTFFTRYVAAELGMDFVRSNELEIADGALTGRVVMQDWGDICDGEQKRLMLLQCCERIGCTPAQAMAVGDGANDLPMMGAAGLSVAYHAKPKVRAQAMVAINEGGLDRLLELLPG